MKISSKQYAQALVETVSDKKGKTVGEAIDNFVKLLTQNNDLKLANEIYGQITDIYNEQEGILDAQVFSAKVLGKKENVVKQQIKSETGAKEINLENIVDKNILGGMIIKYGDKILDMSLKARLEELRRHLTK